MAEHAHIEGRGAGAAAALAAPREASAALVGAPPRSLPSDGHAFWLEVFGHSAPVEIEIGSGDGTFLIAATARAPDRHFLGLERSPSKARRLAVRVERLGLSRVRTLRADAACVLGLIPSASVAAFHIYFPDPWPKRRHARRRLFTRTLVSALSRTIVPDGRLLIASDVYGYVCLMRAQILADPHFEERQSTSDHPGLATAFARKYRASGRAVYPGTFVRRARLSRP